LLERYPFLETSAFLVIGLLGLKLSASLICHFFKGNYWADLIESEAADLVVSIVTAGFFFIPILSSRLFGWPTRVDKPANYDEDIALDMDIPLDSNVGVEKYKKDEATGS